MIEQLFDIPFVAGLALREKQIQQNYRPPIAVHKWFARRPGTLFRALRVPACGQKQDPCRYKRRMDRRRAERQGGGATCANNRSTLTEDGRLVDALWHRMAEDYRMSKALTRGLWAITFRVC